MNFEIALILLFVLLVVIGGHWQRLSLEKQRGALTRLEGKIDLLLKQAGIVYDSYKDVPGAVLGALRAGNKIEAIKRYREAKGTDLKDAKDAVEEIQRRSGL